MIRRLPVGPAALVPLALLLAGCESSGRFGGYPGGFGGGAVAPAPPPVIAAPAPRVESVPLPPPVRSQPLAPPAARGGMDLGGLPENGTSVPIEPPPPAGQRESGLGQPPPGAFPQPGIEPGNPPPQREASLPRPAQPAPAAAGPPSRTAVIGNWTAREASGGSCRVTLSSSPSLDLYKASSSGCQSRDLQRVSAWELRGDEVYLYETGGAVAARLKRSGGAFQGAGAKSGAPITLSK